MVTGEMTAQQHMREAINKHLKSSKLPDHFKGKAKEHMYLMMREAFEYVGSLELIYLRESQHKENQP